MHVPSSFEPISIGRISLVAGQKAPGAAPCGVSLTAFVAALHRLIARGRPLLARRRVDG